MDKKHSGISDGITNASYVGTTHYLLPPTSTASRVGSSLVELTEGNNSGTSESISRSNLSHSARQHSKFAQRRGIRSASDPVRNNISLLLDKLKIDSKKSNDQPAPPEPPTHLTYAEQELQEPIENKKRLVVGTVAQWPYSFGKPNRKPTDNSIKFNSKGLPSQISNFTPLMYRRAVSLRGHSSKRTRELSTMSSTATAVVKPVLRRSNSEKGTRKKGDQNISRSSSNCGVNKTSLQRKGDKSQDDDHSNNLCIPRLHCRDEFDYKILENNSGSCESFDMTELVRRNACCTDMEYYFCSTAALANDLAFLAKDMENYLSDLKIVLHLYRTMKNTSPEQIRQKFDKPSNEIKAMHDLQCHLNDAVRGADGNIMKIAKLFQNEKFEVYQQFTILCPSILKNIQLYKDHLEANYPTFKDKILRPSNRLNFYVQMLNNFLKYGSNAEKNELRRAVNHLEELKMNANTEMTIQIIRDCPIDLHLAGKMLHVGELTYVSGPLQKRPYCLLAFENMLLVTISKVSYFIYVSHYRIEQLVSVGGEKELGLTISTSANKQGSLEVHKFKASSYKVQEKWYFMIEEWLSESTASYEIATDSSSTDLNPAEGQQFPLSLWQVFPFLWKVFTTIKKSKTSNLHKSKQSSSIDSSVTALDDIYEDCKANEKKTLYSLSLELTKKEEEYVQKLNSVFNPETLPPPIELIEQLRRLLNLHEVYFLQELRDAMKKSSRSVIDIFMNYLEKFSTYKYYIFKRALCTTQLPDGIKAQHYIVPVQQFAFYLKWASELGKHENYSEASAYAVDTLATYIYDAKVLLLHEAIPKCYLDFYRTGELKRYGSTELRVRPRQKNIRDGSYLVVLFEKVILITKPNPPAYNLILDLWLNQINFGPPSECSNAFKVEFRQGRNKLPITYEFKAKSTLSKCGWVEALAEELKKIAEQIRKHSNCNYS